MLGAHELMVIDPGPTRRLAMFPLGMVAFPGQRVPLHVFEPRYQQMMADVAAGDREFGIVLIERGHEVGGGDVRSAAGCRVQVEAMDSLGDGRLAVVARGLERIAVETWLADDPYPKAIVRTWARREDPTTDSRLRSDVIDVVTELSHALGATAPWQPPAVDSVAGFLDAVCAQIGFGPFDAQRLLCCASVQDQAQLCIELVRDAITLIELDRRGG